MGRDDVAGVATADGRGTPARSAGHRGDRSASTGPAVGSGPAGGRPGGRRTWRWRSTPELLAAREQAATGRRRPERRRRRRGRGRDDAPFRCAASSGPTDGGCGRPRPGRRRHRPHAARPVPRAARHRPRRAGRRGRAVDRRGLLPVRRDGRLVGDVGLHARHRAHRRALLYALRIRIFAHLQRLSLDYYDREMGGRIMTRMTTDVEALSQLLQTGLINAIVSLFTCAGVFVFLVFSQPALALVATSVLPRCALATWWYDAGRQGPTPGPATRIAAVNANLQESLSGVRVAQAYVARGPQHQRVPRREQRVPRGPARGAAADRPVLPVRALRRHRRGRRARCRLGDGAERDGHRRRGHRVPPVPRPVLLARSSSCRRCSTPGSRRRRRCSRSTS